MQITLHQFLMIVVMAAVVVLLRALPFIIFGGRTNKVPPLLEYLGQVMTAAAIAMLVVYSFAGICDFQNPQFIRYLPALPAVAVTVGMQCWLRNPLVSICAGTGCYMVLLQLFFMPQ